MICRPPHISCHKVHVLYVRGIMLMILISTLWQLFMGTTTILQQKLDQISLTKKLQSESTKEMQ